MLSVDTSLSVPVQGVQPMKIHPTALVDSKAELGEGVEVHAFTIIGPQVKIGAGTVVGSHCVITGRTEIGENNVFFSGGNIGVLSQDLKHKDGLVGRAKIGDRNLFREHVTVSASTMEGYDDDHRVTSVGNDCMIQSNCHIAHDCHVGDEVIMSQLASISGHVTIEEKAILGGMSGVHQECVIGAMAFVGGCSRISKDVAPYMIVEGNPGRCCGPNFVGLRRNGFDGDKRTLVKQMYKIMFRSNLNTTQALHEIEATVPDCDERAHFLGFVRKSLRGITK